MQPPPGRDTSPAEQTAAFDPQRAREWELTAEIDEVSAREPARALDLLRVADARFGTAHEARRLREIELLVALQRIGESHARASAFYRMFPHSEARGRVERLTGYHPRPQGPGE